MALRELAAKPERSVVTIVVIDTVGSTEHIASIDPDDAQALLDRIFVHIRDTVEKAGGLLVSFAGDGGVAVFGWPGSQEDHADRACEAAWEVQHPPKSATALMGPDGTPIKFRIGIHAGLVGLRQQRLQGGANLDLVGGTIHLAAALEKRAPPGEILVSSEAVKLSRAEMQLNDFEGFSALNQLQASVHMLVARPHRLRASDMVQRHRLPMVGRDDERDELNELLPQRGGTNHTAVLIGEPGIGKSRLATAIIRDADSQPITIKKLVFHGDMRKRSTPYAAMRGLIAQALEIDERASADELQHAIFAGGYLPPESGDLSELVTFWRIDNEDAVNAEFPPRFARSLVEIFALFAISEPLLVIVEDLHLIDPESTTCFRLLASQPTAYPYLLLITGRPEALETAQRLTENVIELAPLSPGLMLQMARQVNEQVKADDALLREAVVKAEGIPFILEQLVAGLDDEQSDGSLPQTIQSLIHARLNQLTPESKSIAQALSVLGETIELGFAQQTIGVSAEELQAGLAELEQRRLIHPPLGRAIQFRHAIISESCATTVGRDMKQHLHTSAMEALGANGANASEQAERLSFHAQAAGQFDVALEYLWTAGVKASRSWASGSLKVIFERAVRCIEEIGPNADERFVDFLLVAYSPMLQMGEFARMNQHLDGAIAIAEKLDQPYKLCGTLCQLGMVHWFEGRYEEGKTVCAQALKMAEELDSLPLIFSAQFMLSSNYHGLAQLDDALEQIFALLERLDSVPRTTRLGSAALPASISRAFVSWYMMEIGRYEEGLPYAAEALEIALEANDPYTEVLASLGLGRNYLMLGENGKAEENLRNAHNIAVNNGFYPASIHSTGLLATALSRLGSADVALRIVDGLQVAPKEIRCGELEYYYFHAGHAEALFTNGQHDEAMEALERALTHATSINNQCLMMQAVGLKSRFLLSQDENDPDGLRARELQEGLASQNGLVAWNP